MIYVEIVAAVVACLILGIFSVMCTVTIFSDDFNVTNRDKTPSKEEWKQDE